VTKKALSPVELKCQLYKYKYVLKISSKAVAIIEEADKAPDFNKNIF